MRVFKTFFFHFNSLFQFQSLVIVHSEPTAEGKEKKNLLQKIKSFFSKSKKTEKEEEVNTDTSEQTDKETKKTK